MKKSILLLLLLFLLINCCAASGASLPGDIIKAVNNNDVEKLKSLLKTDPSLVYGKDSLGGTLLHYASYAGSKEAAEFLISQGARVDEKNDCGETPLHKAHAVEMAKILISHGADEKNRTIYGSTLLHYASQSFYTDLIKFYIFRGADVNAKDSRGKTPLHCAVWARKKEAVDLLLANGADVNSTDKDGNTPFPIAIKRIDDTEVGYPVGHCKKEIVISLLEHGARLRNITEAIAAGDLDTVKSLVTSDPGLLNRSLYNGGDTPLCTAACWNHKEIADFLISMSTDVIGKRDLETALCFSSLNGSPEITELLISKGACVNPEKAPLTPLYATLHFGYTEISYISSIDLKRGQIFLKTFDTAEDYIKVARLLIAAGADVNVKRLGQTPLHLAVEKSWKEMAELLILAGADVNSREDETWTKQSTPLHIVAKDGNKNIAELLISKGADINAKDKDGKTPLKLALENGWNVIVDLLRKHGAKE